MEQHFCNSPFAKAIGMLPKRFRDTLHKVRKINQLVLHQLHEFGFPYGIDIGLVI